MPGARGCRITFRHRVRVLQYNSARPGAAYPSHLSPDEFFVVYRCCYKGLRALAIRSAEVRLSSLCQ